MTQTSPLAALLELRSLGRLPRTGWLQRGVQVPESIASHVLGVAHLVLALGPRVQPALDVGKSLELALLHDAPEARTGDLPAPAARQLPEGAKRAMESAVAQDLLGALGPRALEAWSEWQEGASREARFVRLCDRLQLGVELLALARSGCRGLEDFEALVRSIDATEFAPAEALLSELQEALAREVS